MILMQMKFTKRSCRVPGPCVRPSFSTPAY
uniref:Uncharacterized protein n=1 Tax=Arundo donax TaxID=35708 RepID=A0A0A9AHP6_ARUDO